MYKCHLLSEVFSVDVHIFVFLYYKWNLFSYNFRFMSMNLAYIYIKYLHRLHGDINRFFILTTYLL